MINIFIIDDSATVRKVLGDLVSNAPGLNLIGVAQDPIFALKRMQSNWPDVIVSDIEMPRMDGISFLKKIMRERPTPVVVCSTLTQADSALSIKALEHGAVEVIAKPKMNLMEGLNDSAKVLIDAVKAASQANMKRVKTSAPSAVRVDSNLNADVINPNGSPDRVATSMCRAVAIGTSTGGPQALESILTRLPADTPAIAVVQHMPEKFTRAFAERLDSICQVRVKEAAQDDVMQSGLVLIAPGGHHLAIEQRGAQSIAVIKQGPPVSRHKPSVDVLFRSFARAYGKQALGIIMTGMGDDGANGLKEMHDLGSITLAQNKATCVVYGMPAVAVSKGAVDQVVSLDHIAAKIMQYSQGQLPRP